MRTVLSDYLELSKKYKELSAKYALVVEERNHLKLELERLVGGICMSESVPHISDEPVGKTPEDVEEIVDSEEDVEEKPTQKKTRKNKKTNDE